MRERTKRVAGASIFLSLVLLPLHEARSQEGLTLLVGVWRVDAVRLDESLMRTPYYDYDDVRLVGRLVTFSKEKIGTDMAEGTVCYNPKAEVITATADKLVAGSMGGSPGGAAPTAKDFKLPVEGRKSLSLWWVTCSKGDIGPDTPYGPENHNWIAQLTKDQLAMRWYDNTILLLQRLAQGKQPRPYFDCQRATTPTERKICTSVSLSELDQSVSRAFKQVAQGFEALGEHGHLKQLHKTQKKWLVERNRCGANGDCLKKAMHDRLERLATENVP